MLFLQERTHGYTRWFSRQKQMLLYLGTWTQFLGPTWWKQTIEAWEDVRWLPHACKGAHTHTHKTMLLLFFLIFKESTSDHLKSRNKVYRQLKNKGREGPTSENKSHSTAPDRPFNQRPSNWHPWLLSAMWGCTSASAPLAAVSYPSSCFLQGHGNFKVVLSAPRS